MCQSQNYHNEDPVAPVTGLCRVIKYFLDWIEPQIFLESRDLNCMDWCFKSIPPYQCVYRITTKTINSSSHKWNHPLYTQYFHLCKDFHLYVGGHFSFSSETEDYCGHSFSYDLEYAKNAKIQDGTHYLYH